MWPHIDVRNSLFLRLDFHHRCSMPRVGKGKSEREPMIGWRGDSSEYQVID